MPRRPAERRSSYGPNSPTVGERGGRTRGQIIDSTLRLFQERGFHATLVDDIARDANVSRAALYQYFESKDAIFLELAEESGAALIRVVKRLGELGPNQAGFAHLRAWLIAWADVFDTYATIFIQWANVNSPQAELHRRLARFLDTHTTRLSRVIAEARPAGVDPAASAVLFLALLERGHYLRSLYWSPERAAGFTDALAVAMQLYLFPDTPPAAFGSALDPAPIAPRRGSSRAVAPVDRAVAPADRFAGLSPQGRRTVRRLLDAGAHVLAANGFASASVDQVVAEAGVARGTFYKYFADRLDLLRALAEECSATLRSLDAEIVAVEIDPVELRSWLERFLAFRAKYSGVLRVWAERRPDDDALARMSERTAADTVAAFGQLSARLDGHPLIHRASGSVILMSMLEFFPGRAQGTAYALDDRQIVDAQLRMLTHALLRTRPGERAGRRRAPGVRAPLAAAGG